MNFLIADTLQCSLARLTGGEQKAAKTAAFDLQLDPTGKGESFHRLDRVRDPNFSSVRVNDDLRLIVHGTHERRRPCSHAAGPCPRDIPDRRRHGLGAEVNTPPQSGAGISRQAAMEFGNRQAPTGMTGRPRAWFDEAGMLLRFGVVGVAATATHYAVALALSLGAGAPAQVAHLAGFLAAAPASFLGHYHWTFRSRVRVDRAARRFVAVAVGAFLTSAAVLEALTRLAAWGDALGILVGVLVIPAATYVINRIFVF